jgi:hypothetical protein
VSNLQKADKPPEFKPKITPSQVKEKLAEKNKGNDHSENSGASEKTLPPAEKKGKQKKASEKEVETVTFPVNARINAYGFIHMKVGWLAALSWRVDMLIKIERNADGSITVRKA